MPSTPGSATDFARLIKSLIEKKCPVKNICFAWSAGDADFRNPDALRQAMERGVYSFLSLCQALLGCKLENDVQLIYLHSGNGGKAQPHNEAVAALVKALRLEHPKFSCKVVEVRIVHQESVSQQEILDAVVAELQPQSNDRSAVRYEAGERYTARLKAFELEKSAGCAATGGAGKIRSCCSFWLHRRRQGKTVSTSSREEPAA